MKPQLYTAVTKGDLHGFESEVSTFTVASLLEEKTPRGNTVLHLAVNSGHHGLVEGILDRCPELVAAKNSTGQLALHAAAAAGHREIVESLVRSHAKLLGCAHAAVIIMEETDKQGNTALHLATKNGHSQVAEHLVSMNSGGCILANGEQNVCPLYMAAEAANLHLVRLMISQLSTDQTPPMTPRGKSLVHAAIKGGNIDVLKEVIMKYRSANMFDEKGRTPLSFAAAIGFLDGVLCLLDNTPAETMYARDKDGSYPIHQASIKGHVKIVKLFLNRFPDSIELLSQCGRNILHVAAISGQASVVTYILKNISPHDKLMMIEGRDGNGDTPLHLATQRGHARVVSILTRDEDVASHALGIPNEEGKTACDIANDYYHETKCSFQKRLTWQALSYARKPQTLRKITIDEGNTDDQGQSTNNMDTYKDKINTLLLVATLVATVTFAAGFTLPGGNNNDSDHDPHQGTATLVKKRMFQIFLISNTVAMYSSIIASVVLIWALLNDFSMSLASLKLAFPLLGISLSTVSLAFIAGVYLVVSNLTWLAITVLIIGSSSLLILWVIFAPLFFPRSVKHSISRCIFSNLLYLLIIITESDDDDYKED